MSTLWATKLRTRSRRVELLRSPPGRETVTSAPLDNSHGKSVNCQFAERKIRDCSRGEIASCARQHSDVDVVSFLDLAHALAQEIVEILVKGIELGGAVDGDDCDAALVFQGDYLLVCCHCWCGVGSCALWSRCMYLQM